MSAIQTVICKGCRARVNVSNVRYDRNGRDLLCVPCSDVVRSSVRSDVLPKQRYICLHCNYKFARSTLSRTARICPYCASSDITRHDVVTSESVLQEVSTQREIAFLR